MIKFTKLHQSAFMIESEKGIKAIFDIGYLEDEDYISSLSPDICFISHKHKDHFDPSKMVGINIVVAPIDVVEQMKTEPNIRKFNIRANETFSFGDIVVTAKPMNHGAVTAYSINFGYYIEVSNRCKFFFMGDSKFPSKLPEQATHLIIPVGGRKVFDPVEARDYIISNGFSGTIIPVHTDASALDNALSNFRDLIGNGVENLILDAKETYEF